MAKIIKIAFNWFLVVVWLTVIFIFSHIPNLRSDLPSVWDLVLRKIGHMVEFTILVFLLWRALKIHIKFKTALILAALFSVVYATLDEYHQTFITGRHGSWQDVLIDTSGVIIFGLLVILKGYLNDIS